MASIQKYGEFLNEGLFDKPKFDSIEDIFAYQRPHQTNIGNQLLSILMEVRKVSEKAYESLNQLESELEELYAKNPAIETTIREFQEQGKRDAYCAEYIYDTYLAKAK